MPELPEVEVLRLSLLRRLPERRIEGVLLHNPSLRWPVDGRKLRRLTHGRRVEGLRRRAKYLLIDLEKSSTLVVHLGMSGQLTVVPADQPLAPHEHLAFLLDSDERLRFVDPRRFGMVFAAPRGKLPLHPRFAGLGVEPLEDEFDGALLRTRAAGRRGPIKTFLMDAAVVVGVGNIYACEVLWQVGVHPRRSVARISRQTWERISQAIKDVLAEAIHLGGTTLSDFADGEGNSGYFQIALMAYGMEGKPCKRCGREMRRIVQSGRSTFYCPGCQH
jgi:formamidopyrimidine-DNA glycosylase